MTEKTITIGELIEDRDRYLKAYQLQKDWYFRLDEKCRHLQWEIDALKKQRDNYRSALKKIADDESPEVLNPQEYAKEVVYEGEYDEYLAGDSGC